MTCTSIFDKKDSIPPNNDPKKLAIRSLKLLMKTMRKLKLLTDEEVESSTMINKANQRVYETF